MPVKPGLKISRRDDDDLESPTDPIPIPESSSTRLHLDLEHPSVSFRNLITPGKIDESFSRAQWVTSGLRGSTPTPATHVSQESPWSLFGQLMETDGRLQNLESPKLNRKRSRNILEPFVPSLLQGSETDPFLNIHRPSYVRSNSRFAESPGSEQAHVRAEPLGNALTDYESDTSEDSIVSNLAKSKVQTRHWFSLHRFTAIPILYRNILKCAVAYFIASLFTFSPYLSGFISDITSYGLGERLPSPSGHMVATVAVYFNPAKTVGGMVEADMYCIMGLVYSALVCLCSMSMFWWLEVKRGWEWLADVLVILWVGVSMSGVAWMKVWMAKPTFNTACSMMAIILFVVIVKEGGVETLLQVAFIVLLGSLISNLVCYSIWPQSATVNLQRNVTKTLDSFSTLLQILTNTFLLEEPLNQPSHGKLQKAVENHQASFTSLKKNLAEAHSEWLIAGPTNRNRRGTAYQDAVDSLNRLAQHLNGLRSGTRLQYELAKAQCDGKVVLKGRKLRGRQLGETPESDGDGKGKMPEKNGNANQESEGDYLLDEAAAMFGELVDDLGPPLKALSTTCTSSLRRLRDSLGRQSGNITTIKVEEFHQLANKIERALFNFESTSNHAVMRLYRKSDGSSRASMHSYTEEDLTLIGNDNEHVFLVYFFIFTLQEFARELLSLVDAMERIYSIERELATRGSWWKCFINGIVGFRSTSSSVSKEFSGEKGGGRGLRRSLSLSINPRSGYHQPSLSFPKIRPHAPNTIQTPSWSNLTYIGRIQQTLWTIGAKLKERNLKYSIKAGMATGVLAAPAFFDATRPIFTEYRGEWALISFFVVISPTIGATNFMSVHRVLGTLFGAAVAAGIFSLFPENPVILSVFGFFFSLPCFYFIVATPEYATSSRFVLLTYNLTCLFCYNLRRVDVSILDVAFHRSVSVTVGVVWAALVSRFWWPSEARRELSKALGEFCLNMGWLYTRLVASNSFSPEAGDDLDGNNEDLSRSREGASVLSKSASRRLSNSIREFMAMELHLQIKLIELEGLLAQTQHEPRLKGPFPIALYRSILTSLQRILDQLHSIRSVTTREEWWTAMNKERREMVGNIILSFSTLASAFRLKAPLPPYLPPAEQSRQRLVDAIRKLDVVKNRDVKGSKQLLFFAYALTMKGVTRELDYLGRTLQEAFGVIGQSVEEFDTLFKEKRRVTEQNV